MLSHSAQATAVPKGAGVDAEPQGRWKFADLTACRSYGALPLSDDGASFLDGGFSLHYEGPAWCARIRGGVDSSLREQAHGSDFGP